MPDGRRGREPPWLGAAGLGRACLGGLGIDITRLLNLFGTAPRGFGSYTVHTL